MPSPIPLTNRPDLPTGHARTFTDYIDFTSISSRPILTALWKLMLACLVSHVAFVTLARLHTKRPYK
jgi:hypothetical protein